MSEFSYFEVEFDVTLGGRSDPPTIVVRVDPFWNTVTAEEPTFSWIISDTWISISTWRQYHHFQYQTNYLFVILTCSSRYEMRCLRRTPSVRRASLSLVTCSVSVRRRRRGSTSPCNWFHNATASRFSFTTCSNLAVTRDSSSRTVCHNARGVSLIEIRIKTEFSFLREVPCSARVGVGAVEGRA